MQDTSVLLTYGSSIAYLISLILLFVKLKEGGRSRLILTAIQLYSGAIFAIFFIALYFFNSSSSGMSMHMLITASLGTTLYLIYFIEATDSMWLNIRRSAVLLMPVLIAYLIYMLSLRLGVEYVHYDSLIDMIPDIMHFNVWYRMLICLSLFAPVVYAFITLYTNRCNNVNRTWLRLFTFLITVNVISFTMEFVSDNPHLAIISYYVSSVSRLLIVYIELSVRLNGRYTSKSPCVSSKLHRYYK
jgi:hypothetical protein